ncbi:neutral zinc metallopeptidase [Kribbella sp. NPDC023972]|uniref:neutral zinc metallopeptidase n=1 Tax=Kribbella sp. NPDC023972 TaxID=3154795 RepID=UPI0033C70BBD
MSQPPFGGPSGQNPPYPPYPPYQQPGPPQGPPPQTPYGPPPGQYGGQPQYTPVSVAPQQGQGFGWGPSFGPPGPGGPGYQPGWQPQPPKKKSKAPAVLVLGVLAVAIAGVFVRSELGKNADDYTPPVSSGRYTPSPTTTSEPTQEPTDGPTSTSTTAPEPKAIDVVAKNGLYKAGQMATTNCREPRVRPTDTKNAATYWAAVKPCLDRGWAPLVAKAGYKFRPPRMIYWSGTKYSSPCGDGAVSVPFYCPSNQTMYMKVDVFVKTYLEYPDAESKAYSRMWYTRSIAHEYGHHVQELTGILEAAHDLEYDAASYDDRLRMNRRTELQANCFAGVFLAVNKRSYPINGLMLQVWNKWVVTAGDKPNEGTHGSPASQARFMGQSFRTGNPATCNTFSASPNNVS